MRKSWPSLVIRFALILITCLAVLVVLWPRIAPLQISAVSALARPVFRMIEAPNVTVLDARDNELWVYRRIGEGRVTPVLWFDRYAFFAIVPLIALFMATPGLGLRRRCVRTMVGMAALFVLHVGYIVASVELIYAASSGHALGSLQVAVRVLWESAPVLIWVLLTASSWKRILQSLQTEGMESSGSPAAEPVGSEG